MPFTIPMGIWELDPRHLSDEKQSSPVVGQPAPAHRPSIHRGQDARLQLDPGRRRWATASRV
jgi:hypothetical protein